MIVTISDKHCTLFTDVHKKVCADSVETAIMPVLCFVKTVVKMLRTPPHFHRSLGTKVLDDPVQCGASLSFTIFCMVFLTCSTAVGL